MNFQQIVATGTQIPTSVLRTGNEDLSSIRNIWYLMTKVRIIHILNNSGVSSLPNSFWMVQCPVIDVFCAL